MGRLFWKFFFTFWLAQVVTSVGVGVAVWLEHRDDPTHSAAFELGPPPPPMFLEYAVPDEFPSPYPDGLPPRLIGEVSPHHLPLMPIAAGSLVSLLFATLLAWYFARPIDSLRTAFESVANGQLETRIGASMGRRSDELADLGSGFDRMAGRLQNLLDAQRRLLHDVSHELRSPLARLQAAVGLMRQQPERSVEYVERIERDTMRMDKLVGELLTLARLDSGMVGGIGGKVELCEIVADIIADAQFEADSKGCKIDFELREPVHVLGNQELLHRAIENVVRNAIRHSPDGRHVAIAVSASAGHAQVAVADSGPGVLSVDLAAIFEPFFRGDPGCSSLGYGLGLAITRRVVEAHGGKAFASNRSEGGLVVTLELPSG